MTNCILGSLLPLPSGIYGTAVFTLQWTKIRINGFFFFLLVNGKILNCFLYASQYELKIKYTFPFALSTA